MANHGHPPVVPLVMTGAGLVLLLSAIKDLDPICVVKTIATGGNPITTCHHGGPVGDGATIPGTNVPDPRTNPQIPTTGATPRPGQTLLEQANAPGAGHNTGTP